MKFRENKGRINDSKTYSFFFTIRCQGKFIWLVFHPITTQYGIKQPIKKNFFTHGFDYWALFNLTSYSSKSTKRQTFWEENVLGLVTIMKIAFNKNKNRKWKGCYCSVVLSKYFNVKNPIQSSIVTCICNLASLEAETWNGVCISGGYQSFIRWLNFVTAGEEKSTRRGTWLKLGPEL